MKLAFVGGYFISQTPDPDLRVDSLCNGRRGRSCDPSATMATARMTKTRRTMKTRRKDVASRLAQHCHTTLCKGSLTSCQGPKKNGTGYLLVWTHQSVCQNGTAVPWGPKKKPGNHKKSDEHRYNGSRHRASSQPYDNLTMKS